eukprot:31536-Pelagococcus_subviridis.AAC.6
MNRIYEMATTTTERSRPSRTSSHARARTDKATPRVRRDPPDARHARGHRLRRPTSSSQQRQFHRVAAGCGDWPREDTCQSRGYRAKGKNALRNDDRRANGSVLYGKQSTVCLTAAAAQRARDVGQAPHRARLRAVHRGDLVVYPNARVVRGAAGLRGEELDNRGVAVRRDVDLETHADVTRRLRRRRRRRDGGRRRAREMDRRRGDDGRERGGGGGASGGGASGGEIVVEIGAGADED